MESSAAPLRVKATHKKILRKKHKSKRSATGTHVSKSKPETETNSNSASSLLHFSQWRKNEKNKNDSKVDSPTEIDLQLDSFPIEIEHRNSIIANTEPFMVDGKSVQLPSLADCQSDSFSGVADKHSGHGDLANADLPSLADASDCGSSLSGHRSASTSPLGGSPKSKMHERRHSSAMLSPVRASSMQNNELYRKPSLPRSSTVPVQTEMRIRKDFSDHSIGTATATTIKSTETATSADTPKFRTKHVDCNKVLLNSFTCITSFLTCKDKSDMKGTDSNSNDADQQQVREDTQQQVRQDTQQQLRQDTQQQSTADDTPNSTASQHPPQPPSPTNKSKDTQQLQHIRERVEMDILSVLGCTADSADFCMGNIGHGLFCNPDDGMDENDDGTIASACGGGLLGMGRNNRQNKSSPPTSKLRNRNVCERDKAIRRIKRLRKGGFSRTFTLAPVSTFLEEEMKGISNVGKTGSSRFSHRYSKSVYNLMDEDSRSSLMPKTSFSRKLAQQYPLQVTQSAEYITLQKSTRQTIYQENKRQHTQRNFSNRNNCDETDNHSILSTSLLALPQQFEESLRLTRIPSAASVGSTAGGLELYYDSDPGCAVSDDMEHPAEVKNKKSKASVTPEHPVEVNSNNSTASVKQKASLQKKPASATKEKRRKVRKQTKHVTISVGKSKDNAAIGEANIKKKNASNLAIDRMENNDNDDNKDVEGGKKKESKSALARLNPNLLYTVNVDTFDVNNSLLVTQFIEELTNGFISLIWHPTPKQASTPPSNISNPTPLHAQAWFEMGTCLKSILVQPKFMWRGVYHNPNYDDSYDVQRNIHGPAFQTPHFVELLNIVRVIVPKTVDRKVHPFCSLSHAFTMGTSQEETFLFEAATEEERNRFVLGLKLVVARLASKIIVGDKGVFDDFFSPWGSKYKNGKVRSNSKSKSSSPESSKKKVTKNVKQSPTKGIIKSNFITASVNGEGERTNELWGVS